MGSRIWLYWDVYSIQFLVNNFTVFVSRQMWAIIRSPSSFVSTKKVLPSIMRSRFKGRRLASIGLSFWKSKSCGAGAGAGSDDAFLSGFSDPFAGAGSDGCGSSAGASSFLLVPSFLISSRTCLRSLEALNRSSASRWRLRITDLWSNPSFISFKMILASHFNSNDDITRTISSIGVRWSPFVNSSKRLSTSSSVKLLAFVPTRCSNTLYSTDIKSPATHPWPDCLAAFLYCTKRSFCVSGKARTLEKSFASSFSFKP